MRWFRAKEAEAPPPGEEEEEVTVRRAPGFAATFDGLDNRGRCALLDLGPAVDQNLRFYSRFARRIRFADLAGAHARMGPVAALEALLELSEHPYDVVLAWNVLDLTVPTQRGMLMELLGRLTRPGSRLHAMVDMSPSTMGRPWAFKVHSDGERLTQVAAGDLRPITPKLLPADVDRALTPFTVRQAFVLRDGLRAYMAIRD